MLTTEDFTTCALGHSHWGTAGAAGMLLFTRDASGQVLYLLQHRSAFVQHGNTWSVPGGALEAGEDAWTGALREASEELGAMPADLTLFSTLTDDHGGWSYSTVIAESPRAFAVDASDWETGDGGARWVAARDFSTLDLHPGFAATAASLVERVEGALVTA